MSAYGLRDLKPRVGNEGLWEPRRQVAKLSYEVGSSLGGYLLFLLLPDSSLHSEDKAVNWRVKIMAVGDYAQCHEPATFIQCPTGSEFLGCCLTNDASVCTQGCAEQDLKPAFYDPDDQEELSHSPPAGCDSGHEWFVCEPKTSNDQPFVGCYTSSDDPCNAFNLNNLGNATTPANNDAGAASSTDAAVTPSVTAIISGLDYPTTPTPSINGNPHATSSHNSSTATPASASPTTTPASDTSTGAIAGGAVGGVAAVAAIAALIGFIIMYLRRRKARAVPDKQLKGDPAATEGAINQASNQNEKSADTASIPPPPVPAYSPTDPNAPAHKAQPQPQPPTVKPHPVSEIGTSDPPQPISEMASMDPADYPVHSANPAQFKGTRFIPYSAAAVSSARRETSVSNLSLHSRVGGER